MERIAKVVTGPFQAAFDHLNPASSTQSPKTYLMDFFVVLHVQIKSERFYLSFHPILIVVDFK